MEQMRVLMANDPRVYREAIADALKRLRPLIGVSAAEPDELDREVARLRPHLIICSRISAAAVAWAGWLYWVVLYPNGEDRAEIIGGAGAGGHRALVTGPGIGDLLSIVDETELLCRSAAEERRGA